MSFADENGTDPADVAAQANTIKVPYDSKDTVYWFRRLEIQMELRSIKSQFWKRVVLEANLPAEVNETIKDLLIKERNSEGAATIYKDCKARLLKTFGPKPEEDFKLAMGLVMTGLPSQAAKRVKELVCKRDFVDCCCPAAVGNIWKDMLPKDVKLAVASYDLKTQWDEALDRADDVYNASKTAHAVAAVNLDETAPALQHDVAAVKAQAKKKFDIKDRQTWGKYHKDFKGKNPPSKICIRHYKFGKQAYTCKAPGSCPWESYTAPKPE